MAPAGQQLFLDVAETLQHVLLPLLSAQDLLTLSCTCKAIQGWILGTPPQLWQVST